MPLLLILTAMLFAVALSQPAANTTYATCDRTFSCGPITNVTFPFTGGDRPSYCGLPEFALACRDDGTTEFIHDSVSYRVLGLNQTQKSLVLARSDLYNNSCPSVFLNMTLHSAHFSYNVSQNEDLSLFYGCNTSLMESISNNVPPNNYFSCNSTLLNFNDSFYLVGPVPNDPILKVISCGISVSVPMLRSTGNRLTDSRVRIEEALMEGFDVSYSYSAEHERLCSECNRLEGQCGFNAALDQLVCVCDDKPCPFNLTIPPAPTVDGSDAGKDRAKEIITIASLVSMSVVVIAFITICCFLKRRQHSQNGPERKCNRDVENILLQHGSLAPKRYRYSEIKKITKSFSDKLGQGGYGCVYKGMLPDGQLVAVKILAEMDSNGEEFINEVASISRTSHVNIVNLFGFCYEGNKRALVYEYMPNSSLDKFLCNNAWAEHGNSLLDLKKLYEIAVGIAKGLEYLHTGCITRIVHFDIKPQNILLDQDLCPKISDFGLAKLCKKKQSVLSVLGTRGTAGYIAPEVFSRSFGEVSHKSDVYSYGMMLLEMAGARNATVDEVNQSSENYFPDKIYEQVIINADDLRTEEEDDRRRKMLGVGFWCIQTIPSDRPSISKVAEMLEGDVQSIQTPPKPFLFSPVIPGQLSSSSFSANVDTDNSAPDY